MKKSEVAKELYKLAWFRVGVSEFHKLELRVLEHDEKMFNDNEYVASACWPEIEDGRITEFNVQACVPTTFDSWDINEWMGLVNEMKTKKPK